MKKNYKCGVIGLGKLGLCLASVLGSKYKTVGLDINNELIKQLNDYKKNGLLDFPSKERYLVNWFKQADLTVSSDYSSLNDCDVVFCIVPTPSTKNGSFSNEYIINSIQSAKPYLVNCKIFVVVSTVSPGSCVELAKLFNDSLIKLCYNPEFIALGNVIDGLTRPDFILIGEPDKASGDILEDIYNNLTSAKIKRMDILSAEIAKLALNSYLTVKISFANVLGELCELRGGDVDKITDALGCDSRIGVKYFKNGCGYGGPCLRRDNSALLRFIIGTPGIFHKNDSLLNYCELTDLINKHQLDRIYNKITKVFPILKNKTVSIYGLSYKHGIELTESSTGTELVELLRIKGAKVLVDEFSDETDMVIFTLPNNDNVDRYRSVVYRAKKQHAEILDLWNDKTEKFQTKGGLN